MSYREQVMKLADLHRTQRLQNPDEDEDDEVSLGCFMTAVDHISESTCRSHLQSALHTRSSDLRA